MPQPSNTPTGVGTYTFSETSKLPPLMFDWRISLRESRLENYLEVVYTQSHDTDSIVCSDDYARKINRRLQRLDDPDEIIRFDTIDELLASLRSRDNER